MYRIALICAVVLASSRVSAQAPDQHRDHAPSPSPWMLMTDGALFGIFNHQGTDRGVTEFKATNWWMGMATRNAGPGQLTLTGMLSLDAATATPQGYREIFQAGEAYHGEPIVDRQHPHDFLMQAAAIYRVPINGSTGFTIAGAPVGEPALGPVAFMHRPAAAENPIAPLGHHTLDSTHITMGVITAAVDRGPWLFETSLFQGREPDDNRWDLMDPGPLDSWSARAWFTPNAQWRLQVSHGFLKDPEALEPGDLRRTTASGSWFRTSGRGSTAVTVAYGRNDKENGVFHALLAEATIRRGLTSIYQRFEFVDTETALLLGEGADHHLPPSRVAAFTAGAERDLRRWRGYENGVDGDITVYRVPASLEPGYGNGAPSFHVFVRVRPPVGHMGRMWNMIMARPIH